LPYLCLFKPLLTVVDPAELKSTGTANSVAAGPSSSKRAWRARHDRRHIVCFAFVIAITVYVILDIEYPRLGLIRVDVCIGFAGLRKSMK
jgi:hypothetical protein